MCVFFVLPIVVCCCWWIVCVSYAVNRCIRTVGGGAATAAGSFCCCCRWPLPRKSAISNATEHVRNREVSEHNDGRVKQFVRFGGFFSLLQELFSFPRTHDYEGDKRRRGTRPGYTVRAYQQNATGKKRRAFFCLTISHHPYIAGE